MLTSDCSPANVVFQARRCRDLGHGLDGFWEVELHQSVQHSSTSDSGPNLRVR